MVPQGFMLQVNDFEKDNIPSFSVISAFLLSELPWDLRPQHCLQISFFSIYASVSVPPSISAGGKKTREASISATTKDSENIKFLRFFFSLTRKLSRRRQK